MFSSSKRILFLEWSPNTLQHILYRQPLRAMFLFVSNHGDLFEEWRAKESYYFDLQELWLSTSVNCPYCLNHISNQPRHLQIGKNIQVPGLDCVSCRCLESGNIYCEYDEEEWCSDASDCKEMFTALKSENSSYVCKGCNFDNDDDDDDRNTTRTAGEIWFPPNITNNEVACECHNTGEVFCQTNAEIGHDFQMEINCENCTRLKAKRIFSNHGIKFITSVNLYTTSNSFGICAWEI